MTPIEPSQRPQLLPRARLQTDKVTGKPMLLYPEGVLFLNPTGYAIVMLCLKDYTFDKIIATLSAQFNVLPERLVPEVTTYLNQLRSKNLIGLTPAE